MEFQFPHWRYDRVTRDHSPGRRISPRVALMHGRLNHALAFYRNSTSKSHLKNVRGLIPALDCNSKMGKKQEVFMTFTHLKKINH